MANEDKEMTVWSPIRYHEKDSDAVSGPKILKPGSKISKGHPAVPDDETWDAWVEGGVVRSTEWPEDLSPDNPNALSPNAHRLAKLREERERLEAELAGVGGDRRPGYSEEDERNPNRLSQNAGNDVSSSSKSAGDRPQGNQESGQNQ